MQKIDEIKQNLIDSATPKRTPEFQHHLSGYEKPTPVMPLSESSIIRGGLVGAILTSIIGFNAGKYSRLGAVRKRMRFVRSIIVRKPRPYVIPITDYFYPNFRRVVKNIQCYSGQPGIGKSVHFQNIIYLESLKRPTLYLTFKASGTGATFEQDIDTRLDYGVGDNPPILSQIIRAIRKIDEINTRPLLLWAKIIATHLAFGSFSMYVYQSDVILGSNQGAIQGMLGTAYAYYMYLVYPFLLQSFRRTKALVVFDDLNKIDDMGQLSEIARYLQLHEQNRANIVLITSDEETWFKLRKEPGLKDRLRQRAITYDSQYTARQLAKILENDINYVKFVQENRVHPLYTRQLVIMLVQELIGKKEANIRRFMSILSLTDEEQYENFVHVLQSVHKGQITNEEAVVEITKILITSEMETICAKLKHTRRKLPISEQNFIKEMKLLLEKRKLLSDSKVAPSLMVYNILRDRQSEYVFNGQFMYMTFRLAFEEYLRDLEDFHKAENQSYGTGNIKSNPELASREVQAAKKKPTIENPAIVIQKLPEPENKPQ